MKKIYLLLVFVVLYFLNVKSQNLEAPNFFIPNEGQLLYSDGNIAKDVLYYSTMGDATILFKKDRISYIVKKEDREKLLYYNQIRDTNDRLADSLFLKDSTYYYRMDLVFKNANSNMKSKLNKTSDIYYRYLLGHCQDGIKVNPSGELFYEDIYQGIDIKFYTRNSGLKYDIILKPGSNINDLKLEYIGADIEKLKGKIKIKTPVVSWEENIPLSYLVSDDENTEDEKINVDYKVIGNEISFNIPDYDKTKTLVIDPSLTWSTYYNIKQNPIWIPQSTDIYNDQIVLVSRVEDLITPLLVNPGGGAYFQNSMVDNYDLLILLFNTNGQLTWATYFGGSETEYLKGGVKFDQNGKIYLVAKTISSNIPTQSLAGAYSGGQGSAPGTFEDIYVSRFSNSGVLEWGTYIPTDFYSGEIGIDIGPNNNLYIAGTFSLSYGFTPAFPMVNPGGGAYFQGTRTNGLVNTTFELNDESFIVEFNSNCQVAWSTYFGNDANEKINSITVAPNGTIFLTGIAPARYARPAGGGAYIYFPPILQSAGQFYDNNHQNGANKLYLVKFNSNRSLAWASYFGNNTGATQSYNQGYAGKTSILSDSQNNIYIVDGTTDANMPTVSLSGAYNQTSATVGATGTKLYILKFANNTSLNWATYFSGAETNGYWRMNGFVDSDDELFVVAGTPNSDHPTQSSTGYFKATKEGYKDGIISHFSNTGALLWSTYYGGPNTDDEVQSVVVGATSNPCSDKDLFVFGRTGDDGSGGNSWPIVDPGGGAHIQGYPGSSYYQIGIARFGIGGAGVVDTNTTSTTAICENATKALTSSGAGGGTWSIVSGGGSIAGTTYTPANISSTTSVTIRYTDACGTTSDRVFTVNPLPNTPSTPTGPSPVCSGVSTMGYGVTAVSGATSYQWSYSGTGTVTPTGSPSGITATLNATTAGNLTVRAVNACGASAYSSPLAITISTTPAQPGVITGNTNICSSSQTYSVTAVALATTYTWSYSGGGTPTGSTNSTTFTPTSSGTLSVTATNSCGTSAARTLAITVASAAPSQPSAITGATPICSSSQSYSVTNVAGVTYSWSYSGGGTPGGTTNSTTFTPTSSGTLSVTASNACGTSSPRTLAIVVDASAPSQPSTITGSANICSSSQSYSVTNVAGVTYAWTYSGGGTPTGSTNSTTFTPTSSGTLSVTATNSCGTSAARTLAITVASAAPSQPSAITGATPICSSSQSYSVTNVAGVTYSWSYSGGGTPGGTTNSTTFTPTSSGTLSVTASNACGTSSPRTLAIVVDASAPSQPSTITGSANICSSSQSYSVTNVAGVTYAWTYSGGGTPSGTTNSTTFTPTSSGTLSVTASNACGTSSPRTLAITVSTTTPTQPSIISGTTPVCSGSSQSYSVTNVAGVTYAWTYSGGGTPSSTTNSVAFTPTSSGTLSVTASNACGTSPPRTLSIVVDASIPAQPSVITGNDTLCSSGQSYSVTNVAGVTYAWTYSGTGTPSGTTNSTTFTPTTSGTLSVTASNSCGTSAARTLAITVYSGAPATPGAITGTSNFCRGTSQNYSIGVVANATSYTWSYSGTPSVSSTTTSVTFTPLTSGVLSVTATNACGTSAARNLSLTVDTTFPVSIISSGFDMCVGDARTLVGSPVGGTFSVISGGAFGSVTGSTLNANAVGTVQIRYRITNACGNMDDTQSINIVSTSAASITSSTAAMCIGDLRGLTGTPTGGSFSVIGGPGYIGLNDTLTATSSGTVQVEYQYISPCGVTADTVSITINPEPVVTITSASSDMCIGGTRALTGTPGAGTWSVLSGPGSITGSTLTATGAGNIQIEYIASALGCPGSTTQTITVLGTSDATWTNPGNICESAGLVDLTTYLPVTSTPGGVWSGSTSVSAGGILNTAGLGGTTINIKYKVGPTPCADSLTLPVTISIAPDATWSIPSTICESQQFDLDTLLDPSATTGGTWSGPGVTGSIFDPYGLSGPVTIKYVVSNANCSDSLSQTVNNILTAPTAPTVTLSSDTICDGNGVTITASGSGSNVAYNVWDSPTGGTFLGQTPLTLYPTSNTTYYVEAYGANLCPQVGARTSATVVVDILAPVSLGGDQSICYGTSINLSVPNNASYTYLWSDGGITNTYSSTPSSDITVWVSVTNNIGCVVSDTIDVTVNGTTPMVTNDDSSTVVSGKLTAIDVQSNDGQVGLISILNSPSNGTAIVNGNGEIEYTSNADFTGQDVLSYEVCDAFCSAICDTAYVYIRVEHNVFDNPDNGNIGSWGVTPNGDGINDVLLIDGLFEYPDNEITIYNRWGDEIYNAKPYNQDWDGQNPKKFVNGTYFFILKIEGKPKPFKGFIHLQK